MDAFLKRFTYRQWVMCVALAFGLAGRATAQVPGSEMPPVEGVPESVQVPQGMDPYAAPGPTAARPFRPSSPVLVNDQVWFSWYGNASRRAILAPNMFGDLSGTRSIGFSPFSLSVTAGGTSSTPGTTGFNGPQLNAFIMDQGGVRGSYTADLTTTLNPFVVRPTFANVAIPATPFTTTTGAFNTTTGAFNASVPLNENAGVTQAIQTGTRLPVTFNPASQALLTIPGNNLYNLNLVYDVGAGTAGTPATAATPGTTTVIPVFTLFLPNPSGGGIVGRTKVATDNSPIPRDRIIANYDFVSRSTITARGLDFNRFTLGFEKTIFDGVGSVEVRMPFASTANGTTDGTSTEGSHAELGNVALNFKVLLAGGEIFSLTSGIGVSLPTASDSRVNVGNVDLIKVVNEAILCTPYVALAFTPTDRCFGQAWVGFGFDANGNPVKLNTGNGLTQFGRLNDPFGLQVDAQLGYWLLHPATTQGVLRGLAPFAELHYNHTLNSPDIVQVGSIGIGDVQGGFDEATASTGFVAQIQDNLQLSTGVTLPLRNKNNRFGDYQLGFRLNWFFGATADARVRAIPYY